MRRMRHLKWRGRSDLCFFPEPDDDAEQGAILKPEDYQEGRTVSGSYFLDEDGTIYRFGEEAGDVSEIEWGEWAIRPERDKLASIQDTLENLVLKRSMQAFREGGGAW